jgi:uncharacterized protein
MDTSVVRNALIGACCGGVALASLGALVTHKEVPGKIVMATGSTQYFDLATLLKDDLERNGVQLEIRRRMEGYDTLNALVEPGSDINAGFVKGGLLGSLKGSLASEKAHDRHKKFEKLQSVGRLFHEPIWVFTREDLPIESLRDLKGRKILTGNRESGARRIVLQLLKANGVDRDNSERIEKELSSDAQELMNGTADAAVVILPADHEKIQKLLRVKNIRLMDFTRESEAYVNRFPALSKVVLFTGAVDFGEPIPSDNITLLATSAALVVRPEMDPALVSLLAHAIYANPRSGFDKSGDPILFYKAGEFPHVNDPEFEVSKDARLVYKSGELPYLLRTVAPMHNRAGVPFSFTAFANAHWTKLVLLIPMLAIILPLMRAIPVIYNWTVRRRLIYWYRQLKALERTLDRGAAAYDLPKLQVEIDRIDEAVRKIHVPLYYSDQLYELRVHINLVRQQLLARPQQFKMAAE